MGALMTKRNASTESTADGHAPKKRVRTYTYEPVGFDLMAPNKAAPERGTRVVKTQPHGCPKNGTFGHTYIKDASTGEFYGLVLLNSLKEA